MRTLSAIRGVVKQMLRDEFKSGVAQSWEDDELDIYISHVVAEISEARPYQVKETLTTTVASKELDISAIADLLDVDKIEFRTGQDPPDYRNCSVFGTTLTMDIDFNPAADETVYLFCHKLHQLTESTSTLSPQMETATVLGAVAHAAMGKARSQINKVNVGGGRAPSELHGWSMTKLALYQAALRRLAPPRTKQRYPRS